RTENAVPTNRATSRFRREAEAERLRIEGELVNNVHVPAAEILTVRAAGVEWVKACQLNQLEPITIKQYVSLLENHIVPLLGSTPLAKLTPPMVDGFKERLQRKASLKTTKKVISTLWMILNHAARKGMVAQNSAAQVRVRQKQPSRRSTLLSIKGRAGSDH
ncbi:N-terminal phage integrase SAM-like domain-containing protein, partial [Microvirga massiliensis]|uniref:N-terminal phage integrase SAM-like domain-containing protein n=1 Tax=Microvirga massiliensis TaxID=1033741 RepID=UPI001FCD54F6